jgi:hypothetical protein
MDILFEDWYGSSHTNFREDSDLNEQLKKLGDKSTSNPRLRLTITRERFWASFTGFVLTMERRAAFLFSKIKAYWRPGAYFLY